MPTLNLALLNPDRLWQAGDMGIIRAIEYRAQLRDIDVVWQQVNYGEALDTSNIAGVISAGHSLHDAENIIADYRRNKLGALQSAIEDGMPLFASGASFVLSCHQFETTNGKFTSGLDIFHVECALRPKNKQGECALWAPWVSTPNHILPNDTFVPMRTQLTIDDANRPELILGFERGDSHFVTTHPHEALGFLLYDRSGIKGRTLDGVRMGPVWGHTMQGNMLALNPYLTDIWINYCLQYREHEPMEMIEAEKSLLVRQTMLTRILEA